MSLLFLYLLIYELYLYIFFFFNDTATTEIYTLSLHDALPICLSPHVRAAEFAVLIGPGPAVDSYLKDRKSTRLNSSHVRISYAVFCLKKKKNQRYLQYADLTSPQADMFSLARSVLSLVLDSWD